MLQSVEKLIKIVIIMFKSLGSDMWDLNLISRDENILDEIKNRLNVVEQKYLWIQSHKNLNYPNEMQAEKT